MQQEIFDTRQEVLDKRMLVKAVRDWVIDNKKLFWKYEVSCFYKTYSIRISNLPEPAVKDITVWSIGRLISNQQKKQLCDAVKKVCKKLRSLNNSYIDIQIKYVNETVRAEIV